MSGEKILIIDDRRENLLFLANSVLRPEGYKVITAMDGKQGYDKAMAERPDLIITDLKMPRMSGLELISALRKEGNFAPVILTTFYGSEQAAIQAFRLGAKDYIIKPYEVKEMLDSVERALIEQRLRRESMDLKEGAEIRQHLEERVRQLHSLCGIGKAVTGLHDSSEMMRVVVEAAIYLTEAECGQIFLINPQTEQLELRAVRGPSDARARCVQQTGADQTAQKVAQTGSPLIAQRSTGRRAKVPRLAVPLRTNEQIIGVLGVDAKADRSFNDNDRYQMGILADFAAVAVINTQLLEDLKSQIGASSMEASSESEQKPGRSCAPILTESATEAERLSRELRNLASAAQVLAAKLQVQSGAD
ncbi:MAG: response regulator [Anaerolineae bacterium]|jgi:two-component system NtrC family sensor kinase